jgi:non-heme chloroperoxidase
VNRTLVVLLHGAWFHTSSWEGWARRFAAHGFAVRAQSWPERLDGLTLEALIAYHEDAMRALDTTPVLIGHSVGGLIAQRLLGAGLARAAVALAPLPVNGVPLDNAQTRLWSLFEDGPAEEGHDVVTLTPAQFRHTVANAVGEDEAARLFVRYAAPAPRWLFADTAVDTANRTRGPLLLVSGQEDRMVPDAATRAAYKLYGDSTAVTDLKQFADRGHSLAVDSGWRAVADHVLAWLVANGIEATADGD